MAGIGAAGAVGGAIRLASGPAGKSTDRGLVLSSHETPGMGTLEVPIDSSIVRRSGPDQWRSRRLPTSTFTMAAFIWPAQSVEKPTFRIRSRGKAGWGPWTPLPPLHGGADDANPQSATHTGTEPGLGRASRWHPGSRSTAPAHRRLALVLLHPLARKGDAIPSASRSSRAAPGPDTATKKAQQLALLKPEILTRAAWGANEAWRSDRPALNSALQQVHIHHTASGNDYTAAAVPALLRGFYRYHTHNLGWSDIGYNFLVDRFGRIWEGRAGGVDQPVRGAHTRGFNGTSTGVAVIGNFDLVAPDPKILGGVAAVAAWKVYSFSGNPAGSTTVTSEGSDKYRAGKKVALPVIDGHRDTNDTACPGRHLYAALPTVREQVANAISKAWTSFAFDRRGRAGEDVGKRSHRRDADRHTRVLRPSECDRHLHLVAQRRSDPGSDLGVLHLCPGRPGRPGSLSRSLQHKNPDHRSHRHSPRQVRRPARPLCVSRHGHDDADERPSRFESCRQSESSKRPQAGSPSGSASGSKGSTLSTVSRGRSSVDCPRATTK
ncbi:peptidoglycan recognition protein [Nocardioides sp. W3-2-3]|nr:peptidoglycan recognition protein [Nocardioides convexus]